MVRENVRVSITLSSLPAADPVTADPVAAESATTGPDRYPALQVGPFQVWPPVVLAPMAGITNSSFRTLCREAGAAQVQQAPPLQAPDLEQVDGGLYVCEMITTRALVARDRKTMEMIRFAPSEQPRSVQLYGVDPVVVGQAVRIVREDDLADHIDLNFGCPVPKVTRKGGGSAIPYKRKLFAAIIDAAVREAGDLPVTIKMRIGIDEDHITYLDAGRIAQAGGVKAVALHARTARQHYSGTADWSKIARLKEAVTEIPVLGNGDIFAAADALEMMRQTGCDGVVVGRGCQGRPWLFGELTAAFEGRDLPTPPDLRGAAAVLNRHAELLCQEMGDRGIRDLRKHIAWYLKGFSVGSDLRRELGMVSSLEQLADLLSQLDLDQPYPVAAEGPRGRQGSPQTKVVLPYGWLDDPDEEVAVDADAELDTSGG